MLLFLRFPPTFSLSNELEERRKQYIAFVVDSSIINTQRLRAQLFIGSDAFVRKLEEFYQIKNISLLGGGLRIQKNRNVPYLYLLRKADILTI